jgi:hypothetical protein
MGIYIPWDLTINNRDLMENHGVFDVLVEFVQQ